MKKALMLCVCFAFAVSSLFAAPASGFAKKDSGRNPSEHDSGPDSKQEHRNLKFGYGNASPARREPRPNKIDKNEAERISLAHANVSAENVKNLYSELDKKERCWEVSFTDSVTGNSFKMEIAEDDGFVEEFELTCNVDRNGIDKAMAEERAKNVVNTKRTSRIKSSLKGRGDDRYWEVEFTDADTNNDIEVEIMATTGLVSKIKIEYDKKKQRTV